MRLIKIGGGSAINLRGIAEDIAMQDTTQDAARGRGRRAATIIVLGANAVRDELLHDLGKEKRIIQSPSGMRSVFSDEAMLDAIAMAYSGLRATRFVEMLRTARVDAISLSGLDGGLITGRRNRGIRSRENGLVMIVHDASGKPIQLRTELLDVLLNLGLTPVITIPIADENGHAINTDNDEIIRLLCRSIEIDEVIQLIEAPGLLRDPDDDGSIITRLSVAGLKDAAAAAAGGMRRKLHAMARLIESCPVEIRIADGRIDRPLTAVSAGCGTRITAAVAEEVSHVL